MCGIYAAFNLNEKNSLSETSKEEIKSVLSGLRGKDYTGIWENKDKSVFLMHSLLSISGEGKTIQPIKIRNKIYLFNGEIYCFGKLEKNIKNEKQFNNGGNISDTKKLLYCIEKYGFNDTLISINGMYSILIYDLKKNTVEVANDPYEQKPIYYSIFENKLIISSIQILASNNRKISSSLYDESICFSYPISSGSIYKDVNKIDGGFKYTFELSNEINFLKSNYFKRFSGFKPLSKENNIYRQNINQKVLRNKIIDSIERCVMDLDNINLLLSGGIDSTLIAAILIKELNLKVNGYHLFGYSNKDKEDLERLKITKKILSELEVFTYKYNERGSLEFLKENPEIILNDGLEPLSSLLSQISHKERVLLSGLGADELFLGYGRHYANFYRNRNLSCILYYFRNLFPKIISYSSRINFLTLNKNTHYLEIKDSLFSKKVKPFLKTRLPSSIDENTIQKHDIEHALPKYFNPLNDVVGMYFSKEIRSPFLDIEITEELKKLNFNYGNMIGKKFLKDMLLDYGFTESWINHKKIGFAPNTKESYYEWKRNQFSNR